MLEKGNFADSFDHVVVLMMENRSFDNLLGFLYQDDVPSGKTFNGAQGQSNPNFDGQSTVAASSSSGPHMPFPDPGEYIENCMFQLYGRRIERADYNSSEPPDMSGFVTDYYSVLEGLANLNGPMGLPWPGVASVVCADIMKCHVPDTVPVLSALARDFCVFDNWFCALPSATWPNRAFWHADTSYGFADNPVKEAPWSISDWLIGSNEPTLFSRLDDRFGAKTNSWCVYEDQPIALTKLVHFGSLGDKWGPDYFRYLEYEGSDSPNFFSDCASGALPKYSFLEPHFLNEIDRGQFHNDMHPSKWPSSEKWVLWGPGGPGSVPLGEQLMLKVYEAIRCSPCRDRTLFIITFDEHGGCFDHVSPPLATSPDASTFYNEMPEYGFNFKRLGPRVPMVMVSSHLEQNTIVNAEMNHASFLKAMQQKWGLASLGARQDASASFLDELSMGPCREWPPLSKLLKKFPDASTIREVDDEALNELQQLLLAGMRVVAGQTPGLEHLAGLTAATSGELQHFLRQWREGANL